MDLKQAFGKALRQVRLSKGLSQEAFGVVSSRTYLSTLERGIKGPTLEKIESLARRMDVHPVTLLVMTYLQDDKDSSLEEFLVMIENEVQAVNAATISNKAELDTTK